MKTIDSEVKANAREWNRQRIKCIENKVDDSVSISVSRLVFSYIIAFTILPISEF